MELDRIVGELKAERDRLDKAIAALEGIAPSKAGGGRTSQAEQNPQKRAGRRKFSAAARKRMSQAMKRRWAERKKAAKGKRSA